MGTVGTLVPATLCLCAYILLVQHWCSSLHVLVLWVLLVHWCQPLYVSVPICYWYHTGTALYMYWYCGNVWYISTSHSMSLWQYVIGTALVLLFICTGIVGTIGTLVPATLCLSKNMLMLPQWYCCLYVLVLWVLLVHWYHPLYVLIPICYWYHTGTAPNMYWYRGYCWYIGTSHSTSLSLYVTGTTVVLLFTCTGTVGTVGTFVPGTLSLSTNILLALHWTALYMYWYCVHCWYIGASHSMSLCLYVTGTTLALVFICTGAVGTVGTLVTATICLCTNMLLVKHWYSSLHVLVLWELLEHWYQPLYASIPLYPYVASYLDLLFTRDRSNNITTKLYDKRDAFGFHIVNFPFMSSNIPSAPAYGVYASQLVRYARCCSNYSDFLIRHRALVKRLLSQGYKVNHLSNTFKKFYGRHTDLVGQYKKNVCQMFADSISSNDFLF